MAAESADYYPASSRPKASISTRDLGPRDLKYAFVPRQAAVLGMWLFLASLTMLFGSSLIGYLIIRMRSPIAGTMDLPPGLWISTVALLISGLTMHVALRSVRQERQQLFRISMLATGVLAVVFLAVQSTSLFELFQAHLNSLNKNVALYGLVLMLVITHGAHVVGGLFPMGVVTSRALQGKYDHESHQGVKLCSMYWHFLEVVWIVLFGTFLLAN